MCPCMGVRGQPKRNITRVPRDYHRSGVIVAHRVGVCDAKRGTLGSVARIGIHHAFLG